MRIFYKILSILFVLVFITSVSVSLILGFSSTYISNNENSRRNTYYTASNYVNKSKYISIVSKSPYSAGEEGQIVEDNVSCTLNEETYTCQMISTLYNEDSSVVRTSYFPGDGFKYTLAGNTKTKTVFTNDSLVNYFKSLLAGVQTYLSFLAYSNTIIDAYNINYDTNVSFNFSKFTLNKEIMIDYGNEESKQKLRLEFNKKDYVTYIGFVDTDISLKINYKNNKLNIPSLVGYQEN